MTGAEKTPGQVSYEARQVAKGRRMGADDSTPDSEILAVIALAYDELPPGMQADEEAGAQAVLNRAAQAPQASRDDAGTVKHIPTGATWVTWHQGKQPPWEQVAEAVARLTDGGVKIGGGRDEDSGRLYVAVYRDLPETEDE